ncbi:CAP domain-containing protein [Microcoleus sp. FACHB-SPT15]|uniref:CAP domain-containing protein n=1 Tax=Microcoleus sp. FACHB-SPT15 TaxID=2692830 RepID=UPI0017809E5D|nr:CAP domain-containing protein [Microcoleus sp. FACHB-SPT15]MBD1807035.1 CAP domain-containing protein [Microcoleus sp. FACHB-SPT15]
MQKRLAKIILGVFTLVGGVSGCAAAYEVFDSPSQPLPTLSNPPNSTVSQRSTTNEFAALEQSVHQQINKYRQSRNLPPLALDARISEQSRLHSQAMASGKVPFSHNGFEARVKAIGQSIPYGSAAENVAYNQGYSNPDQQAVEGWIKSPGHRKNMEGQFDVTGIGITKNAKGEYYFTQVFIKRR